MSREMTVTVRPNGKVLCEGKTLLLGAEKFCWWGTLILEDRGGPELVWYPPSGCGELRAKLEPGFSYLVKPEARTITRLGERAAGDKRDALSALLEEHEIPAKVLILTQRLRKKRGAGDRVEEGQHCLCVYRKGGRRPRFVRIEVLPECTRDDLAALLSRLLELGSGKAEAAQSGFFKAVRKLTLAHAWLEEHVVIEPQTPVDGRLGDLDHCRYLNRLRVKWRDDSQNHKLPGGEVLWREYALFAACDCRNDYDLPKLIAQLCTAHGTLAVLGRWLSQEQHEFLKAYEGTVRQAAEFILVHWEMVLLRRPGERRYFRWRSRLEAEQADRRKSVQFSAIDRFGASLAPFSDGEIVGRLYQKHGEALPEMLAAMLRKSSAEIPCFCERFERLYFRGGMLCGARRDHTERVLSPREDVVSITPSQVMQGALLAGSTPKRGRPEFLAFLTDGEPGYQIEPGYVGNDATARESAWLTLSDGESANIVVALAWEKDCSLDNRVRVYGLRIRRCGSALTVERWQPERALEVTPTEASCTEYSVIQYLPKNRTPLRVKAA